MAYEDFFNLLREEHKKIKDDLYRMQKEMSASESMKIWAQFKKDILPHLKGEESFFYSALKQEADCKADAEKAMEQHNQAAMVMNELDKTPRVVDWATKFAAFKDAIYGHISWEEDEIFAKARQCLSDMQLRDILNNFKQEEKRVGATIKA